MEQENPYYMPNCPMKLIPKWQNALALSGRLLTWACPNTNFEKVSLRPRGSGNAHSIVRLILHHWSGPARRTWLLVQFDLTCHQGCLDAVCPVARSQLS
jgi:hypothetical protein